MKMFTRPALIAAGLALTLALPTHAETRWIGSWASAQIAPDAKNSLAAEDYPNATLRQVIRLSIGGCRLTAALLDRLTHHCEIFEMNSESFRFRESMKEQKKTRKQT